ncbi:hypothetical protein Anas_04887 [Armadillidium nasatum]|uniref:Uncharacterized protein n=1 Tax=Armadillidium nasatum TaxID=96803 RepID=A0A5N5SPV6_9CRUS|nr:hypothetical protein Anas_04887 [Armadillidium nasatum]
MNKKKRAYDVGSEIYATEGQGHYWLIQVKGKKKEKFNNNNKKKDKYLYWYPSPPLKIEDLRECYCAQGKRIFWAYKKYFHCEVKELKMFLAKENVKA